MVNGHHHGAHGTGQGSPTVHALHRHGAGHDKKKQLKLHQSVEIGKLPSLGGAGGSNKFMLDMTTGEVKKHGMGHIHTGVGLKMH